VLNTGTLYKLRDEQKYLLLRDDSSRLDQHGEHVLEHRFQPKDPHSMMRNCFCMRAPDDILVSSGFPFFPTDVRMLSRIFGG